MRKANRVFEVLVRKGGRAPALLDPDRVDHIEVLHIDTGEIAFFWDVLPHQTGRLARALRADLAQLDGEDFAAKWAEFDPDAGRG